ncbi:hypothetical protein GHT06_015944 [Daphnia sinensis]|uniref:BTB domain-containing protein n=1 Tax=Daphnia sinensis TaxID=1820382 RepID=A0AAD5PXP5_9CRUS|nr:hypothetical protein GHT06_015944 [Daphnia sinensis]
MTLQVREVDEISWCVDWDVDLEQTGGTKQTAFVFNGIPECKPHFTLTCHHGKLKSTDSKHISRSVTLRLTRYDQKSQGETEESNPNSKTARNSIWNCETLSVSIRINRGTWLTKKAGLLHEFTDAKESWTFKDPRFQTNATSDGSLLKCEFYIRFATPSGIEMLGALKRMTDYYFHQQSHCDVSFHFPNDEQPIGAHIKILSSVSSVFAAMFQHDMQESKTGKVFIGDMERDMFYQLLHYIYSGRILTSLTEGTAQKLLLAADKYNVTGLGKECTTFLVSNIHWETAVGLLIWAHVHSIGQVKEAAMRVVADYREIVCTLHAWEVLTKKHPDLCLEATRRMILSSILPK